MTTTSNGPWVSDSALDTRFHQALPRLPKAALRIGIVNLMPHAEQYEQWLVPPLTASSAVEPVWIRVHGRQFSLDDRARIDRIYRTYDESLANGRLHGLIVSGAAVEHLPYEEVRFLDELSEIVDHSMRAGVPVLGLCWGALAVAHLLCGAPKRVYQKKVFGIFETDLLVEDNPIAAGLDDRFWSAHSRYAGFDDDALDSLPVAAHMRTLARSRQAGTVIAESLDHQVVMHIGHPEYSATRLLDEYRRDRRLKVKGVEPPVNVDMEHPVNLWRSNSLVFFANWIRFVTQRAGDHA